MNMQRPSHCHSPISCPSIKKLPNKQGINKPPAINICPTIKLQPFNASISVNSSIAINIGANHYLKLGNEFVGFDRPAEVVRSVIDNYFGGDGLQFAKEYYRQLSELPRYGNFDIVGHFDLITKNCEVAPLFDEDNEMYKRYALDCFYALKDKIHVFEVNTGAMARGYRKTPYPSPFILKEMAKAGVGIVLGSDCHDNAFLAHGFQESLELCKACGVKELQIFTKGGFKGIALV